MDYNKDLRIDQLSLDEEWMRQPELFMRYAELSAQANDRLRKAEENIKVIRSELVLEANEKGEEVLGTGVKATAPNVEAYYRNHKKHKAAKEEWLDANYEADLMATAVVAFRQRKDALENLVRLHGQNYFSTPAAPTGDPVAREHYQEKTRDAEKIALVETTRSRRRARAEGEG